MPRINNIRYKQFKEKGEINTINPDQFLKYIGMIKHKYVNQLKIYFAIAYYTGARPAEILELKGKDITKEGQTVIKIQMVGKKHGLSRPIRIHYRRAYIKEIYKYATGLFEEQFLFPNLRSNKIRTTKYIDRNGKEITKEYPETSCKLWYHFEKCFNGEINPYFLRHNRFSKLMEKGAEAADIMLLKGSKTMESTIMYIHLSKKKSMKIARLMD